MTDKEILENNKLIAEFMGGKQIDSGYFIPYWCIVNMNTIELGKGKISEYHKSWDWLMPVVEKIETLDAKITIKGTICIIKTFIQGYNTESIYETKLESVYTNCIKFIKWYNEQ